MIPVQYIISANQKLSPLSHVKAALKAGCKWIQIQTNGENDKSLIKTATKIKELCREKQATFIIEDNIELVKTIDGDGVHITDNRSLGEVRQLLGEGFLIGCNARNAEEVINYKRQSADYISCGPFRNTNTDEGTEKSAINLTDYENIIRETEAKEIFLPLCAFGDINVADVDPILRTGMRGIAIHIDNDDLKEKQVISTLEEYINL